MTRDWIYCIDCLKVLHSEYDESTYHVEFHCEKCNVTFGISVNSIQEFQEY